MVTSNLLGPLPSERRKSKPQDGEKQDATKKKKTSRQHFDLPEEVPILTTPAEALDSYQGFKEKFAGKLKFREDLQ